MNANRPTASRTSGFSLVEVVLALGVAAVALVSVIGVLGVLGVLGVALDTNGAAGRDTVLVAMSNRVLHELRAVPFDALWSDQPSKALAAVPSSGPASPTRYIFTQEGVAMPADADPADLAALYECIVAKAPDKLTRGLSDGAYNQL